MAVRYLFLSWCHIVLLLNDDRCLFKAVLARDAHDDWFNEPTTQPEPQSSKLNVGGGLKSGVSTAETTKQVTESKASKRSTASSHQGGDAQQGHNCVC